jgi:peptidoglycan/LPS O-acetylase OafA/YrhL
MLFTFIVSGICIAWFSVWGRGTSPEQFCVFNFWFAWCCGAFLADKIMFNRADLNKPFYKLIYAIIFLAFIFVKILPVPAFTIVGYQLDTIIWTAPLVFIIGKEYWFSDSRSIVIRLLAEIGLSSYSLYLFHDPLIMLKNYLAHEFLPGRIQLIGVFAGILIIPILCWYSYLYIEKPFLVRKRKALVNA